MSVNLQREMSNRNSSVWKIGTIFPLYSFKMSQQECFIYTAFNSLPNQVIMNNI